MPAYSSPLVLLLSFSFLCLLLGTLLLTGGDVSSLLSALHPSRSSSPRLPTSSLPSTATTSSSTPLPLQLLASYHTAWSAAAFRASNHSLVRSSDMSSSGSPESLSSTAAPSCYASFPAGRSPVHVLVSVDDPLLNAALSGDTGHQLLQWLAGAHTALSLGLSLLASPVFPGRSHWDAFTGLCSGERRLSQLLLERGGYQQHSATQKSVSQLAASVLDMQPVRAAVDSNQPLVLQLGEVQVSAVDEQTAWLNDSRLLGFVRRKYCTARLYRPVPLDLYAAQRAATLPDSALQTATVEVAGDSGSEQSPLYLPRAFMLAVHVECDQACEKVGGQGEYVQQLAANITAVMRAVAELYAAAEGGRLASLGGSVQLSSQAYIHSPSSLHVHVHLFADRSALDGDRDGNTASKAATLSLAQHFAAARPTSTAAAYTVHTHVRVPSTWAIQHYATADAFVGNMKGALVRGPAATWLPTTLHLPHVFVFGLEWPWAVLRKGLAAPRPMFRHSSDCKDVR
ncbi:hypothetical protein MMC34_008701 [Xylographa carneopallida]|nr:hypothetical protein [Xylographa carneopallida]